MSQQQFKDYHIVVYRGAICKWKMIKGIADPSEVRLATPEEMQKYYWTLLQR